MGYKPNYRMYSKPQTGWHDEPFEYCFSFSMFDITIPVPGNPQPLNFLNNPLQMDPDADFYMRGLSFTIDNVEGGEGGPFEVDFNMRLRDSFGRPLDSDFIPMQAYATSLLGVYAAAPGNPVATAVYPELYCPASSAMWADFQAQGIGNAVSANLAYSFHLYFQGVKRFQNEDCKPGTNTSQTKRIAA